jgi:hypothetical protein
MEPIPEETRLAYSTQVHDVRSGRDAALALWRDNLKHPESREAKYAWSYERNPWGKPLLVLAHQDDAPEAIGVAAAVPRRFEWHGVPCDVGLLVDFAVMARHRSLLPALTLQRRVQSEAAKHFALIYGIPNERAAPVVRRVGLVHVGNMVCHVRVLRSAKYLARYIPRFVARSLGCIGDRLMSLAELLPGIRIRKYRASWAQALDARADELWRSSERGPGPLAIRDMAFCQWRFDSEPASQVQYLVVTGSREDRMAGWFACQRADDALRVRDFWTAGGAQHLDPTLLLLLAREARRAGCASVLFDFHGSAAIERALLAAGFFPRSARPIFAKETGLAPAGGLRDSGWYLTSADEDV